MERSLIKETIKLHVHEHEREKEKQRCAVAGSIAASQFQGRWVWNALPVPMWVCSGFSHFRLPRIHISVNGLPMLMPCQHQIQPWPLIPRIQHGITTWPTQFSPWPTANFTFAFTWLLITHTWTESARPSTPLTTVLSGIWLLLWFSVFAFEIYFRISLSVAIQHVRSCIHPCSSEVLFYTRLHATLASCPLYLGIGSRSTVTLTRILHLLKMNEWIIRLDLVPDYLNASV